MDLFFNRRKLPVLKAFICIFSGLAAAFLSQLIYFNLFDDFALVVSASMFALSAYLIGIFALIPAAIPVVALFLTNDFAGALSLLPYIFISLIMGLLFRKKNLSPIKVIFFASIVSILTSAALIGLWQYIKSPNLPFTRLFELLSSYIEEKALTGYNDISEKTGLSFQDTTYFINVLKSIFVGRFISLKVISVCAVYFTALVAAKLLKLPGFFDVGRTNVILSRISSVIYEICFILILFTNPYSSGIKFYSLLPLNLFIILTPLFIISGIYYIIKIKFTVERSSPLMLIICIAVGFFLNLYAITVLYVAICGCAYSFKYANENKLKDTGNDTKE